MLETATRLNGRPSGEVRVGIWKMTRVSYTSTAITTTTATITATIIATITATITATLKTATHRKVTFMSTATDNEITITMTVNKIMTTAIPNSAPIALLLTTTISDGPSFSWKMY
eukprot:m.32883 g.32883  ORF g.32883 m.32883 type:complete len:115 (-) comp7116_c0_seq2:2755-3099(-)